MELQKCKAGASVSFFENDFAPVIRCTSTFNFFEALLDRSFTSSRSTIKDEARRCYRFGFFQTFANIGSIFGCGRRVTAVTQFFLSPGYVLLPYP
jgi:hypothetical protein